MKNGITFAKRAAVLLLLFSLFALCACSNTNIDETKKFRPGSSTENKEDSSAFNAPNGAEESSATSEPFHASSEVVALHLNKTILSECEFPAHEECYRIQVKDAYLTLEEEDADRYPELAEVLEEEALAAETDAMTILRYLADRVSAQNEYFGEEDSGGECLKELSDIEVRRSDSTALSILYTSYQEEFGVSNRSRYGWTVDTQTGETLYLSDVIRDMDALPALVEQNLVDYVFGGEFYSETTLTSVTLLIRNMAQCLLPFSLRSTRSCSMKPVWLFRKHISLSSRKKAIMSISTRMAHMNLSRCVEKWTKYLGNILAMVSGFTQWQIHLRVFLPTITTLFRSRLKTADTICMSSIRILMNWTGRCSFLSMT